MCGIIACLCHSGSISSVITGINRLQNRGNDSYGITSLTNTGFKTIKKANPNKQSFDVLFSNENLVDSNISMGHCRWATHGGNTDYNAHPHIDNSQKFALVHNGTIDNYLELRNFLIEKGYKFYSDTDSEVIVNLISYHYNILNTDCIENRIEQAIKQTIQMIIGIWACVLICADSPNIIWGFHYFCPLLVAWNDDFSCISLASERAGFDHNVTKCAKLNERQIYSFQNGRSIDLISELLDHSTKIIDKPDPYEYWMIKEINEQKQCLMHLISQRIINNCIVFPELDLKQIIKAQNLIIIGCGTSYYAGKFSRAFFQNVDIFSTVQCIDASEFDLTYLPKNSNSICMLLSQSGETMDLIRVQQQLNEKNIYNIAIINVKNSTIQQKANASILTEANREVAVASTKSYSCQIVIMKLISLWIEQELGTTIKGQLAPLFNIANEVELIIDLYDTKIQQWANKLSQYNNLFILGKKTGYCLAKEASLKLKEVGYIHAESYSTSALKHGPYSLIEPGNPIIFILSKEDISDNINNTIMEVKARGAVVWIVTDWQNDQFVCDDIIVLPYNSELYGILHIVPFQLLSYYIALKKGHNPDYPRNLAKSVTVD